ncbi:hypothetical protein HDU67_003452, partial [Dinochytrium kinnereticum]
MGLGRFMGKDPEGHIRGVKKECIKINKLKDEDIGWAKRFKKANGKEPGFSEVCEWLIKQYGAKRTQMKDLEKCAKRSRKEKWATSKYRAQFGEVYSNLAVVAPESYVVETFLEGLDPRLRRAIQNRDGVFEDGEYI